MKVFRQDPWPDDREPYVFAEGVVNLKYPVGLFAVDTESFSPTLQLIQVGEFEGKLLVAVPERVFLRTTSRRILPSSALAKPTLVEVAAAEAGNLEEPVPDETIKVWIGFLKPAFFDHLEIVDECNVQYCFDSTEDGMLLPFGQGLVDVAQEHFAFFSADGAVPLADEVEEPDIDGEPLVPGDAGYQDLTPGGVHRRVDRLEQALTELTTEMRKLGAAKSAPKKKATAKAPSSKSRPLKPRPGAGFFSSTSSTIRILCWMREWSMRLYKPVYRRENLQQMQKLVSRGSKAMKVKDMNPMVQPADFLSEDEVIEGDNAEDQEGDGSADQGPLAASLSKLTAIVDLLTSEKLKRASTSKLEVALDSGAGSSSDLPLQGTGKKAAAARRALRSSYEEHPEDISALIGRLMNEDLNAVTIGPGMAPPQLCARAWVEFRSRIGAYKTGAYAAWSVAGILDSLMQGHVKKARARASVCLLMLDQASIDRGNWALAGRVGIGGTSTICLLSQPPASCSTRWRITFLEAAGSEVVRACYGTLEGSGRLPGQAKECGQVQSRRKRGRLPTKPEMQTQKGSQNRKRSQRASLPGPNRTADAGSS